MTRMCVLFNFEQVIMLQNAKYSHEVHFLGKIDAIVTEWYLWEIMTQNNIEILKRYEFGSMKIYNYPLLSYKK